MKINRTFNYFNTILGFKICKAKNFIFDVGIVSLKTSISYCLHTLKYYNTNFFIFIFPFQTDTSYQEQKAFQLIFLEVDEISSPHIATKTFAANLSFYSTPNQKFLFNPNFLIF